MVLNYFETTKQRHFNFSYFFSFFQFFIKMVRCSLQCSAPRSIIWIFSSISMHPRHRKRVKEARKNTRNQIERLNFDFKSILSQKQTFFRRPSLESISCAAELLDTGGKPSTKVTAGARWSWTSILQENN